MTVSALSVFEYANGYLEQKQYDVRLVSEFGGPTRSSLGVLVQTEAFDATPFDTVIIGGNSDMAFTPGLLGYLEQAAVDCRQIAAKCAGAFFLAECGLLDGRRATTHWFFAADFKSRYPLVRLKENRLFVIDGPFWTSAGMTANIDLVLAMVEKDFGPHVANAVSRSLILSSRRHGGQPQISALLDLGPTSDRIQTALAFARANLHLPLTVEQLPRLPICLPGNSSVPSVKRQARRRRGRWRNFGSRPRSSWCRTGGIPSRWSRGKSGSVKVSGCAGLSFARSDDRPRPYTATHASLPSVPTIRPCRFWSTRTHDPRIVEPVADNDPLDPRTGLASTVAASTDGRNSGRNDLGPRR